MRDRSTLSRLSRRDLGAWLDHQAPRTLPRSMERLAARALLVLMVIAAFTLWGWR